MPRTSTNAFKRKRSGEEADLDITPMIDVTFLLLIFFMVTSTMQSSVDQDVPPAKHGVGRDSNRATVITIKQPASSGDTPRILLGDGKGPEASVDEVEQYVADGLRAGRSFVVVKAEREVPNGFVQEVLKAVTAVDGVEFSIGVRDKR
ncbi:MAG: biopolymer transporter ExbD [Planctomycetota bacterium]|nr:MAG: biopolymer transporter ExbD [Planctomycetota bacterium]